MASVFINIYSEEMPVIGKALSADEFHRMLARVVARSGGLVSNMSLNSILGADEITITIKIPNGNPTQTLQSLYTVGSRTPVFFGNPP